MASPKKQAAAPATTTTHAAAPQSEFATLIANAMLIRREVIAHLIDPKRDIDKECGYPVDPTIKDYRLMYDREGIAARVVDIFPEETWDENPEVLEKPTGEYTPWEKTWNDLVQKFKVFNVMKRADCLSGVGSFGIIIIGINDGKAMREPVEGIDLKTGKRIGATTTTPAKNAVKREVIYLRPLDESVVSISRYETDVTHPRYGQPVMYQINMAQDNSSATKGAGNTAMAAPEMQSMDIHWTRCIHVADNCKNSMVFGTPRMKKSFNRLYDLRKTLGGAAEMFWKGGFPGLAVETQPNLQNQAPLTQPEKDAIRQEFDDYQNGLQRILALSGMTAKSLAPQIEDPSKHFEVLVKSLCAGEGIPYRIFLGTEEAQLAGAQDKKAWNKRIKHRQLNHATPNIVEPFVERLIAFGVLDEIKFSVAWNDLDAPTQKDKAENAEKMTRAMSAYVTSGLDALMTPLDYLTSVCGYDTDEASAFLERSLGSADGEIEHELDDEEKALAEKESAAKKKPAEKPASKKR